MLSIMAIRVMDCTLRDGSYAVNFQFDSTFTHSLSSSLDKLGFSLIEIGHGAGIGASEKIRRAASSDLEYARAANDAVSEGKWGMFAIPGIAEIGETRAIVDQGMGFLRVGIDVDDLEAGIKFLTQLPANGLDIFVNFMKSYAVPPSVLLERAKKVLDCKNISGVYLVDSAGGMLPDDIARYADSLEPLLSLTELGFHGHDNLGLAVSNSLYLAQRGFTLIDSTLQGIGRSSGNAPTERLVAVFLKLGILTNLNLTSLLKISDELVRPRIPFAGHSGLDTYAGYVQFHTSYMERLLAASRDFDVDPFSLMKGVCELDLAQMKDENLIKIAGELNELGQVSDSPLPPDYYPGNEQS